MPTSVKRQFWSGLSGRLSIAWRSLIRSSILFWSCSSGALIATNDNWKDSQQSEIEATGLAPTNDKESAIRATLAHGSYTAIVRGVNNTVGVGVGRGL